MGNVPIIRLLLNAGADLEYQNMRTWYSVSHLWDPIRPTHMSTSEILELCTSQGFSGWNETDVRGWSPLHRAAAYGSGEDIRNLQYKGANFHNYTTDHLWGPITCAVWNSNVSTFDALMKILPVAEIMGFRDTRGWSLLHCAAQNGCEHIMKALIGIGVDCEALTVGTSDWVKDDLYGKSLTARMIAREYGHGGLWANVAG